MTLNFPNSPTLDQTYSYGERTWVWNGNYWETANFTVGYTGSIGYTGSAGANGANGASDFTALTDTPAGYIDQSGKIVLVNNTEDGLEFGDLPPSAIEFTTLTDTPANYTSQAGKIVLVNTAEDGLEFGDLPAIPLSTPRFLSLIQEGNLRVLDGISRWYAPASVTITKIIARVDEAPTGNNLLLRINKVSASGTTSINIAITASTFKTENNAPNLALAADNYLTVDVTQIGGTNPGKGLRVTFIYE